MVLGEQLGLRFGEHLPCRAACRDLSFVMDLPRFGRLVNQVEGI